MSIFLLVLLRSRSQVFKWRAGSSSWLQTRSHPLCDGLQSTLQQHTAFSLIQKRPQLHPFSELTLVKMLGVYNWTMDFFDIISRTKYLSYRPPSLWTAGIALVSTHRILEQLKKSEVLHFWHCKKPCKVEKKNAAEISFFKAQIQIGDILFGWLSKDWSNLPSIPMIKLDSVEGTW